MVQWAEQSSQKKKSERSLVLLLTWCLDDFMLSRFYTPAFHVVTSFYDLCAPEHTQSLFSSLHTTQLSTATVLSQNCFTRDDLKEAVQVWWSGGKWQGFLSWCTQIMLVDDHEHGRGCFVDHGLVGLGGLKAFLLTRARTFCFICRKYMLSPRFFAHR